MTPEFANIPIEFHAKPNENWSWLPQQRIIRRLSSLVALTGEIITEKTAVRALIDKAVAFGRAQKVDRVWAVLQGQTTIRMAQAVANKLDVPLHTQVWDPFSWWAKANCLDGMTTRRVQFKFDEAIRNSRRVATASKPMAELYKNRFKVDAAPVISSHSRSLAQAPDINSYKTGPLLIGMAGQFYASSEWLQLIQAMQSSNWKIAGRPVRIIAMGPQIPPGAIDSHISFLGWKSQPDAAFILSQCDFLYCPYPFDPTMKEVSQLSFPSKFVLYLAAGRPIVFHGPDYSSLTHYIKSRKCGLLATQLIASAIYNEFERLVRDPESYRTIASNAQTAFLSDFTLGSMERAFNMFIDAGVPANGGNVHLHDHTKVAAANEFMRPQLSYTQRRQSLIWLVFQIARILIAYLQLRPDFKTKIKAIVRKLALKVPCLHHDIHRLWTKRNALRCEIVALQAENIRINVLLQSERSPANAIETATEGKPAPVFPSLISPQYISKLYPDSKTLIIAKAPYALDTILAEDKNNSITDMRMYYTIGDVSYTQLPPVCDPAIEHKASGNKVAHSHSSASTASLLHLVLQEGFEKIIVADENTDNIALVAVVARLASQRLTAVVNTRPEPVCENWITTQTHIDFIDAGIPKHVMTE